MTDLTLNPQAQALICFFLLAFAFKLHISQLAPSVVGPWPGDVGLRDSVAESSAPCRKSSCSQNVVRLSVPMLEAQCAKVYCTSAMVHDPDAM